MASSTRSAGPSPKPKPSGGHASCGEDGLAKRRRDVAERELEVGSGAAAGSDAPAPRAATHGGGHGGLLEVLTREEAEAAEACAAAAAAADEEAEPPLGAVLRLAEVSGCDPEICHDALVASGNNFHAALASLRERALTDGTGIKARAQMRAALQLLNEARTEHSLARGALGGVWIAAAMVLHAFEVVVPERLLELLLAYFGLRHDSPLGLLALLLPLLGVVLGTLLLLRDLDILIGSAPECANCTSTD